MSNGPYRLVPDRLSADTIQALEELLRDARDGKLLGVAFAAMYARHEYIVNSTGEARRNPTFSRGMVMALNDELGNAVTKQMKGDD